jgi:PAS domain-containing protein
MGERRNASGGGHRAARGESARDPSVVDAAGDSFFRTVVESASDAVVTVDETGAIVFANPAVAETFGYEPSELVGRPAATLVPEQHR